MVKGRITPEIRAIVARAVQDEPGAVRELPKLRDGYAIQWCPCGNHVVVAKGFGQGVSDCSRCRNNPTVAALILDEVLKSVTQYPDFKRILRNMNLKPGGKSVCLACGVTLSGRRHAKTCSTKCRKALSRSGVNFDNFDPTSRPIYRRFL